MELSSNIVAEAYARSRIATQAEPKPAIADGAAQLSRDFAATLQQSEEAARSAVSGNVDPHALVQALTQTELAVETAVTIRNRVVEAYQEILRMPV